MKQLSITQFAQHILGKPLYPYQREAAEAILASIHNGDGHIFTVMMARQSGKNQLSAVLEAYLLMNRLEGTIVKAAPTFIPQIINSRLRLLSLLDTPQTRERIWTSRGYVVGLTPEAHPLSSRAQVGPRVMFFSAGPESNVVGATADILLEIDEAQDVTPEKFDRDFRPMAAVSNATTVLYGTAWTDTTLLAQQRATNLALEEQTCERYHFEYDWHALAAFNPAYRRYVEQEIARLGKDHLAIQTQYLLHPANGADSFLNALQQALLQGTHAWEDAPSGGLLGDGAYIAGMDVAGEERPQPALATHTTSTAGRRKRDSTVITIGRVYYNEFNLPAIEVVHQQWWTGMSHLEQYAATLALIERWGLQALVIDATGLGAGLASLLSSHFNGGPIIPFTFTRPSKSRLAYQLLGLLNSGRIKLYTRDTAPSQLYEECWKQLCHARYRLPAPETLDIYVDPRDGHDDFLISLALLAEAVNVFTTPAASTLIIPKQSYMDESTF